MLLDTLTGLAALLVPPTVAATAMAVLGQAESGGVTAEGIGGLAGAGATAALFGWYLYYQSAVAEPRREADRAKQLETLTVNHASLMAQQQKDFAALLVGMQDRNDTARKLQQAESDRLLDALLKQHSHVCPLGPASPASCPLRTPSKVHREPPSAEGEA